MNSFSSLYLAAEKCKGIEITGRGGGGGWIRRQSKTIISNTLDQK